MADKPTVDWLGWGMAKKTGKTLSSRQAQLAKQECEAEGKYWDKATQQCKASPPEQTPKAPPPRK